MISSFFDVSGDSRQTRQSLSTLNIRSPPRARHSSTNVSSPGLLSTVTRSQKGSGRLNLSPAFEAVPGIYVIGPKNPRRDGKSFWKVGMATSLRSRLQDYQICFPEGFYIKLLLTLPTPQGDWRDGNIRKVVYMLEKRIHDALAGEPQIERLTIVHKRSEWFSAKYSDIRAVIVRVLFSLGLQDFVRMHDRLSSAKYGPILDSKRGQAQIPIGDSAEAFATSATLADRKDELLTNDEQEAVQGMLEMQASIDWSQYGLSGVLLDDAREYTVQKIVDERSRNGETEYKVRWKGYRAADDTWLSESSLTTAAERLAEFKVQKAARGAASNLMRMGTHVGYG